MRICKICSATLPVASATISILLKNVLAVLPSLLLPDPCVGASTIIPNFL